MAWDDTPPTTEELQGGADWTKTPPTEQELQNSQPISGLESFGRGAANNFPLAPQAIAGGEALSGVGDEGGYSKNLADWNAKAAAAKTANPKVYGAGAVTGAAAPLLIPGVGEALESAPLAGNALYGAANAISNTDLTKSPGEAIKQAAIGAGIGAGTAGLVKGLTPEAETLENFATKEAGKSVGINPAVMGRMEPEEQQALGQFVQQHGLVDMNKEEALQKALGVEDEIGSKIGEVGKQSKDLGLVADSDTHLNAAIALDQKARDLGTLANPEARKLARSYAAGRDDIMGLGNQPGWDAIQKLKTQYGKIAFDKTGGVSNRANADTYFALSDMLKGIVKNAQANPGLGQEYKDALRGYSQIQPVIKGLTKLAGKESATEAGHGGHGLVGLMRQIPGQQNPAINIPTAIATGLLMHPAAGVAVGMPTITNAAFRSGLASKAAGALPLARQGMTQEIMDYLESVGRKQKTNNKTTVTTP